MQHVAVKDVLKKAIEHAERGKRCAQLPDRSQELVRPDARSKELHGQAQAGERDRDREDEKRQIEYRGSGTGRRS